MKTTTVLKNIFSIVTLWARIPQLGKWVVGKISCAWVRGGKVRWIVVELLLRLRMCHHLSFFAQHFPVMKYLHSLKAYIVGVINLWIEIVRQGNASWWELFACRYITGSSRHFFEVV